MDVKPTPFPFINHGLCNSAPACDLLVIAVRAEGVRNDLKGITKEQMDKALQLIDKYFCFNQIRYYEKETYGEKLTILFEDEYLDDQDRVGEFDLNYNRIFINRGACGRAVTACGIPVYNALEAFLIIVQHEILHYFQSVTLYDYGDFKYGENEVYGDQIVEHTSEFRALSREMFGLEEMHVVTRPK